MNTLEILSKVESILSKDEMEQLYAYMESYRKEPPTGYFLFPNSDINALRQVENLANNVAELFQDYDEMMAASELVKVLKRLPLQGVNNES